MSTKGKEYKLAIRIAGVIDKSFTTSLTATNAALKKNITAIDADFTKLDKGFDKIMTAGKKCFNALATAAGVASLAIGAATAASIAVGSEFESAFAGVKKTVDATEAEYARLRQDILDMTKVIPSSASDIAGVMEIAGQLGIATENLTDFTETMINLGVSTNLSAEEAATALAKFANITRMDPSDYERLGSVIVDLGNNFATTEADIVAMATRLASTGDLVGLSEPQIMALSTAMSSVGIAAESGGSTMAKLLKKMQLAVETNSESLADYASVAGMTGEEFKKAFQDDAVVALSAFIDGVDNVERNGKSAVAVLDDMDLKEVRLSNTILALAGSSENMSDAVATANKAWGENTALAIEAGKRYETAESQMQLMKNAFSELGIAAYDELREPFVNTIGAITEKVQGLTDYVSGPNGIKKWLKDIGTELPTLQRKFKKFAEPVFNGIVSVGKWVVKHGDGIISVLAGVGAALATYKIASTLSHIVKAIMTLTSMNPATLGILGVVSAVGLLVGAFTAYEQYEQGLIDKSLQEHFGNIALSMEDIQKVAEHIVGSDSLGGVKEALEAFEDLDEISSTMENAIAEIDKMNWKVSIGMELSEEEQGQYKTSIQEYVTAAQEYALQSQYAVSLNLAVGFGDSAEGANIATKVEQFYQNSYDEMTSLGQSLSDAVNAAFADNVLDADEIDQIVDLQAKMADVQQSLATGEFEASLSMIGLDYSGVALDAESFKNLQAELDTQLETAKAAYKESYLKNYASTSAAHENGSLTDAEFQSAIKLLEDEYFKNLSDLEQRVATFQVDTIASAYSEDIGKNFFNIQGSIDKEIESLMNAGYTSAEQWRFGIEEVLFAIEDSIDISKDDKLALGELYESLQPTLEQLKELATEYTEAGKEIPQEISAAINNIYTFGAISGDQGAIWQMVGEQISDNEEYATVLALAQEAGSGIPQEIFDAMTDEGVMTEIDENVDYILESIKTGLQEGIDITIPVYYELASYGIKSKKAGIPSSDININSFTSFEDFNKFINNRADGGLATEPELTWFAEKGPEMAIPIDGSRNAISLWEKTGQLLGMDSRLDGVDLSGGGSSPNISYNPTLQFYGEAPSRNDLEDALKVSQDEFDSLMERYFKTHGRVSFG